MAKVSIVIPDVPPKEPHVSPTTSAMGRETSSPMDQLSPSSRSCEALGWVLRVFKQHAERIER